MIEYVKINSNRAHTITFPYYADNGRLEKLQIHPGDNEVESKVWKVVKDEYEKRSPFYLRGLTKKGED